MGSALVRESGGSKVGDDDKIYFFFSERALELDCDREMTVARVARVCKVRDPPPLHYTQDGGVDDNGLFDSRNVPSFRGTWAAPGPCRRSGPHSRKPVWSVPSRSAMSPSTT